jgi:subtilisin family serine protease
MRKILFILFLFLSQGIFSYASIDCRKEQENYDSIKNRVVSTMDNWRSLSPNDPKKVSLGQSLSDLFIQAVTVENAYNECVSSVQSLNQRIENYLNLWNNYFRRSQWDKAIEQYNKIIILNPESYRAHYNIASVYLNKNDAKNALEYYEHARYYARGREQIEESEESIEELKWDIEKGMYKNKPMSSDTFSHLQGYLHDLRVPDAWEKVAKNNKVVVAVIDDGVNINHPDLTDNIWVETGSAYGSSKIKNFVGDELPDNFPTGKHGTMVAGIIWASANNNRWIAGIAKNVSIMPLRVFDFAWNAREKDIINAMHFAISKKVNIINLSLGQSQFSYSNQYDEVMKLAYENGIIVVIAGGNGDVLSFKNSGINTSINPISPVCNSQGNKKYSIGVGSLNISWARARWSNYGSCISFFSPGENIFSTSIAVFNKEYWVDYDTDSGTSFSAPMIAGIVALWFNEFGFVSPDIVYESLNESLRLNSSGSYIVDASQYLDILKQKQKIIQEQQLFFNTNEKTKEQAITQKSKLSRLSDPDYLATLGYISKKSPTSAYKLWDILPRQEAVALAMKVSNAYIPESYTCRGIFWDVSARKPNSWVCRIIENALDRGVITQEGGNYFKPEESMPLVEAVSMLLRASNIRIQQYSGGEFEPWQTNVIGTAFSLWLVESTFDFPISKIATKADVFAIARRIIEMRQ